MKNEKEETIFYFLVVFNLLNIIHPFEKTFKDLVKLNCNTQEYLYVTNRFKYKFVSVITQISVTVTLLYLC